MAVALIPASVEQQPILANLLELYAHDFSEFLDIDLGPDGRFGYPLLPFYFNSPNRHPFLVTVDGKLAGFVLVKRGSDVRGGETAWDMAEFFVVRKYRRRAIGTEIALQVWTLFRGPWEVRVMSANRAALHFWERAISTFLAHPVESVAIEKAGQSWRLFSFDSRAGARA